MSLSSRSSHTLLAVFALLGKRGRPPVVLKEPRVAASALPALAGAVTHAVGVEVGEDLAFGRLDDGAHRHARHVVGAAFAVLLPALAVHARFGAAVGMIPEREQRRHVAIGNEPHVAAVATVAAIGTAAGHVGFATERHRARAAVAGFDVNLRGIDEGAAHVTSGTCVPDAL